MQAVTRSQKGTKGPLRIPRVALAIAFFVRDNRHPCVSEGEHGWR